MSATPRRAAVVVEPGAPRGAAATAPHVLLHGVEQRPCSKRGFGGCAAVDAFPSPRPPPRRRRRHRPAKSRAAPRSAPVGAGGVEVANARGGSAADPEAFSFSPTRRFRLVSRRTPRSRRSRVDGRRGRGVRAAGWFEGVRSRRVDVDERGTHSPSRRRARHLRRGVRAAAVRVQKPQRATRHGFVFVPRALHDADARGDGSLFGAEGARPCPTGRRPARHERAVGAGEGAGEGEGAATKKKRAADELARAPPPTTRGRRPKGVRSRGRWGTVAAAVRWRRAAEGARPARPCRTRTASCPQGRTASSPAAVDPSASSWHTGQLDVAFDVRETFSGFPFAEAEDVAARTRACSSSLRRSRSRKRTCRGAPQVRPRARRGRRRTAPISSGAPTRAPRDARRRSGTGGQAPERDFVVASRPDARRRHRQFVARVELVPLVRLQNARVSELAPHQLQALDVRAARLEQTSGNASGNALRQKKAKRRLRRARRRAAGADVRARHAPARAAAHVLVRRLPAEHGVLVRAARGCARQWWQVTGASRPRAPLVNAAS